MNRMQSLPHPRCGFSRLRARGGTVKGRRRGRARKRNSGRTGGEWKVREQGKRPRRIERERERTKADGGIIIKRDISYVGGRIVSATRHTRRFCARKARSCAAPLIKGTRVRALACSRARLIRRRPRCECAPELSRPYVNRSGPSAHEGPLPKKRERGGGGGEEGRERKKGRGREKEKRGEKGALRLARGCNTVGLQHRRCQTAHSKRNLEYERPIFRYSGTPLCVSLCFYFFPFSHLQL